MPSFRPTRPRYDHYNITPDWRTFRQYFARLEKQGMGINLASYVGATQVRRMVLGDDDMQPTPAQLEQMKELVRQAMHDGAVGVSTSLEYAPAPYAKTEELIALASESLEVRRNLCHAHAQRGRLRSSRPSMKPCASAREGHIPVEIWHLKVAGKAELGTHARGCRQDQRRPRRRSRRRRRHLRLHRMVQQLFRLHSAWAHDGGDAKLIERLKDPATRARIRKDMLTPSKTGTTNGRRSPARKPS